MDWLPRGLLELIEAPAGSSPVVLQVLVAVLDVPVLRNLSGDHEFNHRVAELCNFQN